MARKQHKRWFLREWRKLRKLTQDQLAERTGLSKPYISQLERGERQYTQELAETFARELQCGVPDLISRAPSDRKGALFAMVSRLDDDQAEKVAGVLAALYPAEP